MATSSGWLSWQKLENYRGARTLGLFQWGQQLIARSKLLAGESSLDLEAAYREIAEYPLNLGTHEIAFYARLPIQDMSHDDVRSQSALYELPGLKEATDEWDQQNACITPAQRLGRQIFHPAPAIQEIAAHRFIAESLSTPKQQELPNESAKRSGTHVPDEFLERILTVGFVGVDFAFSDDTLQAEFKKWLAGRRAVLGKAGLRSLSKPIPVKQLGHRRPVLKFTSGARRRWADHQVLAYLDIKIRAMLDGLPMPTADAIGTHLFPHRCDPRNGDDLGRVVTQEVAPLARLLTTRDAMWRLVANGQPEMLRGRELG
jgi:hypothetical protein